MTELPTEPGAYWWRQEPRHVWTMLLVFSRVSASNDSGLVARVLIGDPGFYARQIEAFRGGEWVKINPPHATLDVLRGNQ